MALLLFVLIFGLLDFGRVVFAYSVIASAAREGARYGAVQPQDEPGIIAAVQSRTTSMEIAEEDIEVSVLSHEVIVTVTHDFQPVTPIISSVVGVVTMGSTARQFREVSQGVTP